MIEPDPKDIEQNKRSLHALYAALKGDIYSFIDEVAESLAYQKAISHSYEDLLKSAYSHERYLQTVSQRLEKAGVPAHLVTFVYAILSAPRLTTWHVENARTFIDWPEQWDTFTTSQKRWIQIVAGSNVSTNETAEAARAVLIDEIKELVR